VSRSVGIPAVQGREDVNQPGLQEVLHRRKQRCIATILGIKEREVDEFISAETQAKLRKVILDEINDFYDIALDLLNSVDNGNVTINQLWLDKLDELYNHVVVNTVSSNGTKV